MITESFGKTITEVKVYTATVHAAGSFQISSFGVIRMRKKWLTAGVGFGIGAVMLLVSGFSAMANTSGYDVYKAALKNTRAAESITSNLGLTITDNGTMVISGQANIKLDHKSKTMNMTATIDDGTQSHSFNSYSQDGKVIFKRGDHEVYRIMEQNAPKWQHKGDMQNPSRAAEQIIDSLMGNIRELATVERESDGFKQAELHLTGSQIPTVVNAVASLITSKAAGSDGWNHDWNHGENSSNSSNWLSDLNVNIPKLTDNIKVEKINLDARINSDQVLEQQTAEINITGTDDAGKTHAIAIHLQIDFSGFNQTTPERVDLTGKPTMEIQNNWTKRGWQH